MLRVFLGAWLRAGEGIGWLAAGTMPNSLSLLNAPRLSFSDLGILLFLFPFSLSFFFVCVCVFLLLSLEPGRCSSDLFSVQQTTYRIGNHVYYWVWLRPDRLM